MADITMCQDKECPKRNECYRFTAKVNQWRQSYFADKVRDGEKCDYFITITNMTPQERSEITLIYKNV